jgi:hypothetical protein
MTTTEQAREWKRRYRARNRDKILAANKIYRETHREQRRAYAIKYRERSAELARTRYARDPDVKRRNYEANKTAACAELERSNGTDDFVVSGQGS